MAFTEVILTEKISTLGSEADIVRVRRGYARNFLLPRGKALEVSKGSLRRVNHLKAKRAEREARELTAAEELASKINKLSAVFTLEAGGSGKAFGSVTAKDIHDRILAELKLEDLPKHAVVLDKPIKESGDHDVAVRLHADVAATLRVRVDVHVAESAQAADGGEGAPAPVKRARKKAAAAEE